MNCRKTSSLLSAYIDRELTGVEMLEVRAHIDQCTECRSEQESLLQTKRLLSSLSYTTPRAELEQLLVVRAERVTNPSLMERILPPEWSDAMIWRWEGVGTLGSPRLRPLAATAVLSLAGLCLATVSVNQPGDESPFGDIPMTQNFAVYVGPTGTLTRVPMMPAMGDNISRRNGNLMPVSLMQAGNISGVCQSMATPSLPSAVRSEDRMPAGWENELILPNTNESVFAPAMAAPRPQRNMPVVIFSTQGY